MGFWWRLHWFTTAHNRFGFKWISFRINVVSITKWCNWMRIFWISPLTYGIYYDGVKFQMLKIWYICIWSQLSDSCNALSRYQSYVRATIQGKSMVISEWYTFTIESDVCLFLIFVVCLGMPAQTSANLSTSLRNNGSACAVSRGYLLSFCW